MRNLVLRRCEDRCVLTQLIDAMLVVADFLKLMLILSDLIKDTPLKL
jgi:hypothetical protein